MRHIGTSGAVLAAAALSIAIGGMTLPVAHADDAKVMCLGVNSCKGQSECKSASNACKGQNSCKGLGWLSLTKEECGTRGGKTG